MKRKALRQISGLCCCPGHTGGVQPLFCGSRGPVQSAYMTLGRKLKENLWGEACCAHTAPSPHLLYYLPLHLLPLPPPPDLRKLWDHSDLGTGTQAHTLNPWEPHTQTGQRFRRERPWKARFHTGRRRLLEEDKCQDSCFQKGTWWAALEGEEARTWGHSSQPNSIIIICFYCCYNLSSGYYVPGIMLND